MAKNKQFVAYYRVSTKKQGKSGLGLDSQKEIVENYLQSIDGTVIEDFVEVESGKRSDRIELNKAIRLAHQKGATLIIAKLDRFSRKVSFISTLMDKGVDFVIAEMPNASPFQIHIHSAMAEEEARLISQRTSLALKKAKERGVKLGVNGKVLAKANKKSANQFARKLRNEIHALSQCGFGYSDIAREFNNLGITTFTGKRWYPQTVKNVVSRLRIEVE